MTRRYCGRIGGAVTSESGRCPECGAPIVSHRTLPADVCGTWTRCTRDCGAEDGSTPHVHGHLCALAPGHSGEHDGGER